MNAGLSRRGFVVGAGALLGAAAVRVGGLFPETALAAQVAPPPGVLTAKDIVIRNFARSDIDRAVAMSRRDPHGRALWSSLAALGLRPDHAVAYGAYAHVRPHAPDEGFVLSVLLVGEGRAGKFTYAIDVTGAPKAFVASWAIGRPDVIAFHAFERGAVRRRSVVTLIEDAAVIELADGTRRVIQARPQTGRGPGLAAPMGECGLNGVWCAVACSTAVGLTCWAESTMVCTGLALLCAPCGVFCEVVTTVVCVVVTTVSCYYVCQPC